MNNKELFVDIVSKILLLEPDQITENLSRKEVEEWDSMSHLVLVSECESTFNVSLTDEEVVEIQNIADLKNSLNNHGVII